MDKKAMDKLLTEAALRLETAADDMADEIAARKGIYKQINDAAKKARVLRALDRWSQRD